MNTGHCTPVPKAGNQTTMSKLTRSIYPKKCLIGKCNEKSSTSENDVGITCIFKLSCFHCKGITVLY